MVSDNSTGVEEKNLWGLWGSRKKLENDSRKTVPRRGTHTPFGRRWRSSRPRGPSALPRWHRRQHCPGPAGLPLSYHWLRLWSDWWQGFSLEPPLRQSCYRSLADRSLKQGQGMQSNSTLNKPRGKLFEELQLDFVLWATAVRGVKWRTAWTEISERQSPQPYREDSEAWTAVSRMQILTWKMYCHAGCWVCHHYISSNIKSCSLLVFTVC